MKYLHTMIRVTDPAKTIAFFELLGLKEARRLENEQGRFTLIFLSAPGDESAEVELTHNQGRTEPYQLGDGYGHVAFCVDDLDAEHRRISDAGYGPNPIKEFHREGALLARFFFVSDPDGYKIEVLQRHGRYR